jgi:hypothetical protein
MGDRSTIRIRAPKVKVRKGEQAKGTKVHEPKAEYEPTVEEGLEEFYQDDDEELWAGCEDCDSDWLSDWDEEE